MKLTLQKTHRPRMEKAKERTGLSYNQIINSLFACGESTLQDLERAHGTGKGAAK